MMVESAKVPEEETPYYQFINQPVLYSSGTASNAQIVDGIVNLMLGSGLQVSDYTDDGLKGLRNVATNVYNKLDTDTQSLWKASTMTDNGSLKVNVDVVSSTLGVAYDMFGDVSTTGGYSGYTSDGSIVDSQKNIGVSYSVVDFLAGSIYIYRRSLSGTSYSSVSGAGSMASPVKNGIHKSLMYNVGGYSFYSSSWVMNGSVYDKMVSGYEYRFGQSLPSKWLGGNSTLYLLFTNSSIDQSGVFSFPQSRISFSLVKVPASYFSEYTNESVYGYTLNPNALVYANKIDSSFAIADIYSSSLLSTPSRVNNVVNVDGDLYISRGVNGLFDVDGVAGLLHVPAGSIKYGTMAIPGAGMVGDGWKNVADGLLTIGAVASAGLGLDWLLSNLSTILGSSSGTVTPDPDDGGDVTVGGDILAWLTGGALAIEIGKALGNVLDLDPINKFFDGIGNTMVKLLDGIKDIADTALNLPSILLEAGGLILADCIRTIQDIPAALWGLFSGALSGISDILGWLTGSLAGVLGDIQTKLADMLKALGSLTFGSIDFDSLLDGIKALFIPTDLVLSDYFNNFVTKFNTQMGLFGLPFTIFGSFINALTTTSKPCLAWSDAKFKDDLIFPAGSVCLDDYVASIGYTKIYNWYLDVVDLGCFLFAISMTRKKYKEVMSNGG